MVGHEIPLPWFYFQLFVSSVQEVGIYNQEELVEAFARKLEKQREAKSKDNKNEKHVKHVRENLHALTEAYDNLFNNLRHDMFVHLLKDPEESIRELGLCVG